MTLAPGPHVVMTTDAVGGVWTYSTALSRALCADGCRVTLVTLGPRPLREQRTAVADISDLSLIETDIALEWMDPEGFNRDEALARLAEVGQQVRPDIVHINGFRDALAEWSAPVVVVAHSCVRSWWHACHGGEPDPRWGSYASDVARGLAECDAWIAPSNSFRETIERLYHPRLRGRVIANAVEADRGSAPAKEPYILAAGRFWDEAKNLTTLAAAASDVDWPIRIAGTIAQDRLTPKPAQATGAIVLGHIPLESLRARMREAAVFVSPSLYEPFGLAALEAAHCGCALALADIATYREIWDGAAVFFDPRDPHALAFAINRLCRDDRLRLDLQDKARSLAQNYTVSRTTQRYRALYDELATSASLARHLLVRSAAMEARP